MIHKIFTKHYFIGSQRIASKLGSGRFNNVYGRNGCYVTAGQQDYAERINQIEQQREEYYKELGIPPGVPTMKGAYGDPENTGVGYNTIITELGDHSVPKNWEQYIIKKGKGETPGPPIIWGEPQSPEEVEPGYGYIADDTIEEETFFYHSDHLGSTSYITDQDGNITQYTAYLPYGELLVDEHSSSEDLPYKFNGKELDEETGLYYYGARYLNPTSSIWYGVDPLFEKYPHSSPYTYCINNPVKLIDLDGCSYSPVYDFNGNFLGTDDDGLQGEAIIMDKKDFRQGMSHADALSKNKGVNGLNSKEAKKKYEKHYAGLPNRPDYDGYLTLKEANEWYRKGSGEPLFTSLEKIDLSGILSLGERYVGQEETFNLLLYSGSINDGLVYGNIKLRRYPNHSVRAYSDKYDFDMHSYWNPLNWGRNIETIIGKKVAGEGKSFEINIYGSKKLTPVLPWIK